MPPKDAIPLKDRPGSASDATGALPGSASEATGALPGSASQPSAAYESSGSSEVTRSPSYFKEGSSACPPSIDFKELQVETFTRVFTVLVKVGDTIGDVKQEIQKQEGIPKDQLGLLFKGKK